MKELSLSEAQPVRAVARRTTLRDCFYHWFSELEAQGEDTTFRLGSVYRSEQPIWTQLPHHSFDGLGGLYHVLEQRSGERLELPVLPGPYPGAFERTLAALRVLFTPARKLLSFKREVPTQRDQPPISAWALFTRDETSELRGRARVLGTSLNAFFLAALTSAIRPLLADGPGVVNWVVPINMRGVEPDLAPTDNQAATLDVCFSLQANARAIDDRINEQRSANVHWGVWQLLKWLGAAGPTVIRFVARRELGVRKHGSFSNMGNLRLVGKAPESSIESEWWMAINPVQRARPLGAACLSYDGRLALTLQIHPVLGLDRSAVQDVMGAWVAALHQPPSADNKSTAGTTTLVPRAGGVNRT